MAAFASNIHNDILVHIFGYLIGDPRALGACCCVSKSWLKAAEDHQIWGVILKKQYRFSKQRTPAAIANQKREWQRRLEVDSTAVAALDDIVFPRKRHALLLRLVDLGEDIKDLLHGAADAEGSQHIGSRHWARIALSRVQAGCSTRSVRDRLADFEAHVALQGGSSTAGTVQCCMDSAIDIAALIEPGCLDIRRDVMVQVDALGAMLRCRLEGIRPGSLQAIMELGIVLFAPRDETGKPCLAGNHEDYYAPENSLVHRVMQRGVGIPISLSIILAAVAERAGIKVELIGAPNRFLTRFLITHGPSAGEDRWICAFEGRVLTRQQVLQLLGNSPSIDGNAALLKELYRSLPPRQFVERMVNNLLRVFNDDAHHDPMSSVAIMRFLSSVCPDRPNVWKSSIIQAEINLGHFEAALETIQAELDDQDLQDFISGRIKEQQEEQEIRLRVPGMKFRVGDVVRHVKYGYRGVIWGWDVKCQASPGWVHQMGIKSLPGGSDQPFYQTLVDSRDRPGDQSTYVAQENLEFLPRHEAQTDEDYLIQHPEVPKLFDGIAAGASRYKPNRFLATLFPQDGLTD